MQGERIGIPRIGDVIVCAAFENGWRRKDELRHPTWVTDHAPLKANDYEELARDGSREAAGFVVEESCLCQRSVSWTERRRSGYGGINEWDEECRESAKLVVARRLASDGTYDPEGETIRFNIWGHGGGDVGSRSVREVLRECHDGYRRHAIMGAPIYRLRTMSRVVRFV